MVLLKSEIAYYDVAVQQVNHYAMGISPVWKILFGIGQFIFFKQYL